MDLYKSTDGGDTWTDINYNPGLPPGLRGKMGVAVSPARPERVWALIEAEDGGLYRSDDGGATWEKVNGQPTLWWRPWYYIHVFAHPTDSDTCYVLSVDFWKSTDGGRTFTALPMPHGDHHDLWIDPRDPRRMIEGNDGGATVTLNGGETWSSLYNQPTASFFHLAVDTRFPYRVYGTQMDNTAVSVPSRTNEGGTSWRDCYAVGSAESGKISVRPDNPDVVIAGAIGSAPGGGGVLLRYDHATGQTRIITVWPEDQAFEPGKNLKYRFQFHFPSALSPHDPDTLYACANVVFRSRDEGTSWEQISPDLTCNDLSKMSEPAAGPISIQVTVPFHIGSILSFAESPRELGVLWAGSDDGLVHLSRDDGRTWQEVTPLGLPERALVTVVEPSPHDPAAAYVCATNYKTDDTRPYLYRTRDYGVTWTLITEGIPEDDFTRVIREDPERRGLLYAGTETGVYVSFDDGERWERLRGNLPAVPVHDMAVKDGDLVIATHGRGFWILDDVTPLREWGAGVAGRRAHLFRPRAAYRPFPRLRPGRPAGSGKNYERPGGHVVTYVERAGPWGERERVYLDAGQNPPEGALVHYWLGASATVVRLTFTDGAGRVIRRLSSEEGTPRLSTGVGLHRVVWDLRLPGVAGPAVTLPGPVVVPGTYGAGLEVDGETWRQTLDVRQDPRVRVTQEELEAQLALLQAIGDQARAVNEAVERVQRVRAQVEEWEGRARGLAAEAELREVGAAVKAKLGAIEAALVPVPGRNPQRPPPTRLGGKLASLASVVASADARPTRQAEAVFAEVAGRIAQQLAALRAVLEGEVAAFARLVREREVPLVA
ncbi:MAG: glycosyl hydrolase [Armatimonadota bacterium]|nr:glycosyl hydrolase [Armatimonadota bacterium]MDR7573781.1 glycosyl hydrolase [Armatimonadota bacterium]MDR7586528.1 glycosyl hydrolase [Armatimonadota bacterium]